MKDYPCIHLNKVIEKENDLNAINIILESVGAEETNHMPIMDIMLFEKCIKKRLVCFEYPKGDTVMNKLTISLFIKHLAHCFLVMDLYSVEELLSRDVVEKYLRLDFDLTYYEFKALWDGISLEYRSFIERAAQFYYDAFYCIKLKKFPICSLYAKWILGHKCSVEFKNYSSFKSIVIK